jgi:prepilin-type N-terminal cleavage/methylation domain-containing protein
LSALLNSAKTLLTIINPNGKTKTAFTLVEMSIVIIIISIALSVIIVSKILITSAKLNKVNKDARDIQIITDVFRNTFDCLAGDCKFSELPISISKLTPSGCFNLQADYLTPLATIIIPIFNTGEIDSNAKRTCMFYEFMALEPQAFGLPRDTVANRVNSLVGVNNANALDKVFFNNNKIILDITSVLNTQNQGYNAAIQSNNASISVQQSYTDPNGLLLTWSASTCANYIVNTLNMSEYNNCLPNVCNNIIYCNAGCTGDNLTNLFLSYQPSCSHQLYEYNQYMVNRDDYLNATANISILQNNNQILTNNINANITILNNPVQLLTVGIIAAISKSLFSETQPFIASFKMQAMWDIRTITATTQTYPYEAAYLPQTTGKMMLIARNSSTNNINSTDNTNTAIAPANDNMAGFDANFAGKLDRKFDDGMPYTGNIIAGKNVADLANTNGCTNTNMTNFAAVTNNLTAGYNNSKDIRNGCVVGIVIRS